MSWRQIIPGVYEVALEPEVDNKATQEWVESLIKLSNIPPWTATTKRFSKWLHQAGQEAWWGSVSQYGSGDYTHPFLTLLGQTGLGKTHLALGIGWEWIGRGKTVLYYHVVDLLNALRDGYRHPGEADYSYIITFAKNCTLLILDDLGVQKETEWADEQLDFIIDFRYERYKPLVVTTNLALDKLTPRIADRLWEGTLVHLKGQSFRGKAKKEA